MGRRWYVINIAAIGCRHQLPVREWSTRNKMAVEQLRRDLVNRSRRTNVKAVVDIDDLLVRCVNGNIIRIWIDRHRRGEDENLRYAYLRLRKVRISTSS